jgi:hypothetical protein
MANMATFYRRDMIILRNIYLGLQIIIHGGPNRERRHTGGMSGQRLQVRATPTHTQ